VPRTEAQNEAIRAESRAKILAAALELFAREGYEATSVREVAQAAGVAQGLLYSYFAGKEGLLHAIFERCMDDVRRSFAAARGETPRPLEGLIRASFAIVRENLDFWRLSYSLRGQPRALGSLGEEIGAWSAQIRAELEGHYRRAGAAQPELDAALLFGLIDGVAQHYALDPQGYPLDAVVERMVARFVPGAPAGRD
jgi:AcrR family transcriptional regulator